VTVQQNSSSSAKSTKSGDGGGKVANSTGIPAVVSNDVASLQQEENVSISGSNARLMIMKKLSRKSEVRGLISMPVKNMNQFILYE